MYQKPSRLSSWGHITPFHLGHPIWLQHNHHPFPWSSSPSKSSLAYWTEGKILLVISKIQIFSLVCDRSNGHSFFITVLVSSFTNQNICRNSSLYRITSCFHFFFSAFPDGLTGRQQQRKYQLYQLCCHAHTQDNLIIILSFFIVALVSLRFA